MHPSHAAFTYCEEHRQELLSFARQQELVNLACTGTACVKPREATTLAIQAVVHRLTAFVPLMQRERPGTGSASTSADSPILSSAP